MREGLSGFVGESGYPNVVIDGKPGVSPVDQAGCQGGTDQILLVEPFNNGENEPADLRKQPAVVSEAGTQNTRESPNELPVR